MKRLIFAALVGLLLPLACSPTSESGDAGGDTAEMAMDTGAETSTDTGVDGGDVEADASDGCTIQADCADHEYCHDATCKKAPSCSNWSSCVFKFENKEPGLGGRAICRDGTCQLACVLDKHCPAGQICTDFGKCREFDGEITGEAPGGDSRQKLKAGVAQKLMRFPIGLSLGGYGSRAGRETGPYGRYVESLRATHGQMHGLYARAFVLDNGARQIMFVRVPMIFTPMALHEAVARKLQEATGKDWRDSLIISSTHTHSGPARFYHLPSDSPLPLGSFGTDTFHQKAFDWAVDSIAGAATDALDDLSPAKFGMTVVEGFDTDDAISSDRWSQTPQFDDNRLLVMRIDDTEGNPRAVAVSYGTHGTIHSEDYFTGDSLGGAERGLEAALGEEYGKFVPVMYFNENGGTMSPRGAHRGHKGPQRFAKLGSELADRAMKAIRQMEMTRDLELKARTYRFPITYDLVGYEPGEYGRSGLKTSRQQYQYGGIQCGGQPADNDPSTHAKPDSVACAIGMQRLLFNRPPTLFTRSQMTALKVGDMTMLTMPGEPSMELGWQVLKRLEASHDIDPLNAWILGYAQDHQFYLTPTNLRGKRPPFPGYRGKTPSETPDYAYSWLQGGYEAKMSVWGWKFGDFLLDRADKAVELLEDPEAQRELPTALPTQFSREEQSFPVDESQPDRVGTVVEDVPEEVMRLETTEFAWIGGDPGAEMPQAPLVRLQRKIDGSFESLQTARHRLYTNREPVMMTRVRVRNADDEDPSNDAWVWVVRWEELEDFPTGDYRFKVEGHYRDAGSRESYETTSRSFAVVANEDLNVDVSAKTNIGPGATIRARLAYPAAERIRYQGTDTDPGRVTGHFRMRHPDVPSGAPHPPAIGGDIAPSGVTVTLRKNGARLATLTGGDVALQSETIKAHGVDDLPITVAEAVYGKPLSPPYTIHLTVTDVHGNTGEGSTTVQSN